MDFQHGSCTCEAASLIHLNHTKYTVKIYGHPRAKSKKLLQAALYSVTKIQGFLMYLQEPTS